MIPKTIHYCWFGGNPLPPLALKCINSWRKNCPDYEIKEWNESNFDINSAPLYVKQAYEAKKWAFVTDYVRLWAMVNYGGIYMDTDVEVVRSLDKFLRHQAFSGFEDAARIPTGIMACERGFPLFQEFLHYYDNVPFLDEEGNTSVVTNVTIITNECLKRGLQPDNTFQVVDGFALYPQDVFCPIDYATGFMKKTRRTATIHWFSGSWHSADETKKVLERRKRLRKDYYRHLPNRILIKILGEKRYKKVKGYIKKDRSRLMDNNF